MKRKTCSFAAAAGGIIGSVFLSTNLLTETAKA